MIHYKEVEAVVAFVLVDASLFLLSRKLVYIIHLFV